MTCPRTLISTASYRSRAAHTSDVAVLFRQWRLPKLCAGAADIGGCPSLHRRFDGLCNRQQASVLRQVECPDPVAFEKPCTVRLARWRVRQHYPALLPSGTLDSGKANTGVMPSA